MTWPIYIVDGHKHVVPDDDARQHIFDPDCWCKPWSPPDDPITLVHVSRDGRERGEPDAVPRPQ